ncbi:MAG TPA: hypothetical protein PLU17_05770, partial [Chitinophagaceae bacterium]|nr:hypothetical protein [Chitinophagaceae bacterium]
MKKRLLVLSIITAIVISGFYLQQNHIIIDSNIEYENSNEEHIQREAWENEKLVDPITREIPAGITYKNYSFLKELQHKESLSNERKTRGGTWVNRGPWNVGGRTRAMAIDIMDENHLVIGAVSGGIWQSFNGGLTWARVSDVNGHPGVVSISQDTRPGKTNIWYALSGELYGTSASGGESFYLGDGAFKSIDNGTTWTPIASTASGTPNTFSSNFQGGWRIASIPVDTVDAGIYMATYGSIYRSKDTGKTWKAVLGNGNNSYFTEVKVSSTGIVYAALSTS